ncbi:MAG TPA: hypothetical protein PKE45_26375, partial [Caldilineaceae bacterium]|nr:hypothetical protein [Caldilineaceae bacterium]
MTTAHEIVIDGRSFAYTATAGTLVLKDETGKAKASIFFVAYHLDDQDGVGERPITFSFNGGPGSSSVWLHLGLLGPRRVVSGDVGQVAPPPYRLTDNEYTLLTVSDLVFIDPVSTGYSRAAQGEEANQFHGLEKDIESVGDFIRLYVSRFKRWRSPKFLIGESYGTTRAVGLSGHLQNRHGLYLNGLMLISVVLDFATLSFEPGFDLPYLLHLPTYAATAHYHGRAGQDKVHDLRSFLAEVETFVRGEYALALFKGDRLSGDERRQIVAQLTRFTGLSAAYLEQTDLRVEINRFCKELLRHEQRTVGRLDSRFQGADRDAAGEHPEADPSYQAILGPYGGALNAYLREELNYATDLPYELLASLYEQWDYNKHQNKFVHVGDTLRAAMAQIGVFDVRFLPF